MGNWIGENFRLKPAILMLTGVLSMVAASYVRYVSTGSLRVNENPIYGLPLALSVGLASLGLALGVFVWYRVVTKAGDFHLNPRQTFCLAMLSTLFSLPMLPMLSNDIFSLLGFGEILAQGYNPYLRGDVLYQTEYINYVDPKWANIICPYGPFNLFLFYLSAALGKTVLTSIWIYKILCLAACVAGLHFMYKLSLSAGDSDYNVFALVALSPLIWLQGAGQNHNDIIGLAFFAPAAWCINQKKFIASAVLLALAISVKITYMVVLPLYLFIGWQDANRTLVGFVSKQWKPALIGFATLTIVYYPFWIGLDTITAPFKSQGPLRPSGSYPDLLGEIGAAVLGGGMETKLSIWAWLVPLTQLISLALVLILMWKLWQNRDERRIWGLVLAIASVMLCVYTHRVFNWYFILLLPILAYFVNKSWAFWFLWITVAGIAQDFAQISADAGHIVYIIIIATSTPLTLILYFYKISGRWMAINA